MIIGLMGFEFQSANKGCEALGYSFINILTEILYDNFILYVFTNDNLGNVPEQYPDLKFIKIPLKIKDFSAKTIRAMLKCDFIFDITLGDSFSDIYSQKQCLGNIRFKFLAELFAKQYILLPQTYGPFSDKKILKFAKYIINKASYVYCRDKKSQEYLNLIIPNKKTYLSTDIAFLLPYQEKKHLFPNDKINIGINISGLLWNGGFNQKNQFNMTFDYKRFIEEIILYFSKNPLVKIYLIPHVIDISLDAYDDDYKISVLIAQKNNLDIAPKFDTPIQAKSYIAGMDYFIGSRMHSTIAAFSCGIPTIPVSYSRKFEGLFGSFDYPYIVHGTKDNFQEAMEMVKEGFKNRDYLKKKIYKSKIKIEEMLIMFKYSLKEYMNY